MGTTTDNALLHALVGQQEGKSGGGSAAFDARTERRLRAGISLENLRSHGAMLAETRLFQTAPTRRQKLQSPVDDVPTPAARCGASPDSVTAETVGEIDDFGVQACLPGFGRVRETLSPRLQRLESARGELARKASAALCYSRDYMKMQSNLARGRVCSVFRKKTKDELEKEELMRLFANAVKAGSVKVVRLDEPSFR